MLHGFLRIRSKLGMCKTRRRRRNRKKKNDTAAASRKETIKTHDNSGVDVPWSDLNHDVLLLVMMRLGIVEFFAFNGVCKSWRSLAVSNKNMFIVSRPPMAIHVSRVASYKQQCHFKDFEGRKFKPIIPHYEGGMCVGVTYGYLILLSGKNKDLRLVNLMTRHELSFPNVPDPDILFCCHVNVRTILVFSLPISRWVLVVSNFCDHEVWFSVEGKQEWIEVKTPFRVSDLHYFKGKIYAIHSSSSDELDLESDELMCQIRLYPEPEFVLLEAESIPNSDFRCPTFVCCGENLYVIDRLSSHPHKNMHEVDFGEMKLVSHETKGEEYAFFLGNDEHCSGALPVVIVDLRSPCMRHVVTDKNEKGNFFYATLWYFFHDCLNPNLLHE